MPRLTKMTTSRWITLISLIKSSMNQTPVPQRAVQVQRAWYHHRQPAHQLRRMANSRARLSKTLVKKGRTYEPLEVHRHVRRSWSFLAPSPGLCQTLQYPLFQLPQHQALLLFPIESAGLVADGCLCIIRIDVVSALCNPICPQHTIAAVLHNSKQKGTVIKGPTDINLFGLMSDKRHDLIM